MDTNYSDYSDPTEKLLRVAYPVLVSLSMPLCLYYISMEVATIIAIAQGHYNLLTQVTALSNMQANVYASISLITFIILAVLLTYNLVKKKQNETVLICFFIWAVAFGEWILENLYKTLG